MFIFSWKYLLLKGEGLNILVCMRQNSFVLFYEYEFSSWKRGVTTSSKLVVFLRFCNIWHWIVFLAFFVAAVLYYIERQQTHLSHWICQFQRQDLKNNTNTFSRVLSQSFCQFEPLTELWKHSLLSCQQSQMVKSQGLSKRMGGQISLIKKFWHLPKIIVLFRSLPTQPALSDVLKNALLEKNGKEMAN